MADFKKDEWKDEPEFQLPTHGEGDYLSYSDGFRAGAEAAAKRCIEYDEETSMGPAPDGEMYATAIRALPIPEAK